MAGGQRQGERGCTSSNTSGRTGGDVYVAVAVVIVVGVVGVIIIAVLAGVEVVFGDVGGVQVGHAGSWVREVAELCWKLVKEGATVMEEDKETEGELRRWSDKSGEGGIFVADVFLLMMMLLVVLVMFFKMVSVFW